VPSTNADDRVTDIKFVPDKDAPKDDDNHQGDIPQAVQSASDALPPVQQDRNAQEQWQMVSDAGKNFFKDVAKEGIKSPEALPEVVEKEALKHGVELGKQETLWAVEKLAHDVDPKNAQLLEDIQSKAVSGMKDALADFAGVERWPHPRDTTGSALNRLGYDAYMDRLKKLPHDQAANLKAVLRNPQERLTFNQTMYFGRYNERGTRQ
jgi:hypothetical protein